MSLAELAEKAMNQASRSVLAQVLYFLAHNPYIFDSSEGLQLWMGITEEELTPVLELLSQQGVLQVFGSSDNLIYTLASKEIDEAKAEQLLELVLGQEATREA